MTIRLMTFLLGAALTVPTWTLAHEGHEHSVMGTVQKVDKKLVEVKTQDEKTKEEKVLSIVLNDKTAVLRGKRTVTEADIKAGERIVLTVVSTKSADGKETLTAKQIRLADVTAPSETQRHGF
jgi:hypothetical protein